MARMLPATPRASAPPGERFLFQALRDKLPDTMTVFHGLRINQGQNGADHRVEREADFVIVDPNRGYLNLEVKGGLISHRHGQWVSQSAIGDVHAIEDPGLQAQRTVRAIDDYLAKATWFARVERRPRYGWAVAFPDCDARGLAGPSLSRDLVLDRADIADLAANIGHLFDAAGVATPMSPEHHRRLLDALAPAFQLVPRLGGQITAEGDQLLRLTEQQTALLDFLDEPFVAVKGGAGTGKTLVAIERARRLAATSRRVLFLCFNRPLAEHLSRDRPEYRVETFHELVRQITEQAGLPFRVPDDPAAQTEFWRTEAVQTVHDILAEGRGPCFDDIIVDEGQDFLELWWLVVRQLLAPRDGSTLWVFYDPDQDIYGGMELEKLGYVAGRLTTNCRNTRAIAERSCAFVGRNPILKAEAPAGTPVVEIDVTGGPKAMVDAVRRELVRLIDHEKLSESQVVILTPSVRKSPVCAETHLSRFKLVQYPDSGGPGRVMYSSLHRFKGLEADAVILCDVQPDSPQCSARHLYVAASRAKHVLVLLRAATAS